MGILSALLGVFLIAYPLATATITTLLLGWVLIFVGIAQFIFALHSQTVGKFFLKVLLGAIYLVTGVALAFFPIAGVAAPARQRLLMGLLIIGRWPSSSFWAIGTLVGVSVLMGGISRTIIATKIRNAASSLEGTTRRAA